MRQTAGSRTALSPRAETGHASRRSTESPAAGRTASSRPTMADVPGRAKKEPAGAVGTGGWASYKKTTSERRQQFPKLEIDEGPAVLIRFAQPEPFAFIYRHWVNKHPYTCLGGEEECPLCGAGDKAKPVVFYNVITVADASLKVWEMSAEPTRKVQTHYDKLAGQEKALSDPDLYFLVSKAKKDNGFFDYDVEKVRARDLLEEHGVEPLSDDEITEACKKLFDNTLIRVPTKADLRIVVDDLKDD